MQLALKLVAVILASLAMVHTSPVGGNNLALRIDHGGDGNYGLSTTQGVNDPGNGNGGLNGRQEINDGGDGNGELNGRQGINDGGDGNGGLNGNPPRAS